MRPPFLTKLVHGLLLTAKNFPNYVETWNYLIDRTENLRGDKDETPNDGYITVDNTDAENPVIRFAPPDDFWNRQSSLSVISGDANYDSKQKSIELTSDVSGDQYYQIYDFDNPNKVEITSFASLSGYDVIGRKTGANPQVAYLSLSSLSGGGGDVISGDADILGDQKSIEIEDEDGKKYYQLYGFENGHGGSYYANLSNWTSTGDDISCRATVYRGGNNGKFVMRYTNQGGSNPEVEYGDLQLVARIPNVSAMIRGDTDVIPGTQNSIQKKIDPTSGKVYLQMYNFDNPTKQDDVRIDLEYNQYKDWSDTKPGVDLVTRNRTTGKIEYRNLQIKVPEDSVHKDQLNKHEDDINDLQSDVIDLSSQISSLENDYWEKGGSETTNYGSAIGNDNQDKVIDLNGQYLIVGNRITLDWDRQQTYDVAGVISYDWNNRQMYDFFGKPVINVGGCNLGDTTGKKSVAWKDRQLWDGNLHQVAEWNNNEFKINNVLKIGNTTLNETQLQRLLALIS